MRFVVYGAGAIGGVVGGRLAQAGHEVVLIARGEHHDAIRDEGLRLVTPDAEPVTLSIPVVSHPAGIDFRDDDVVLLAMKSQHTGKALSALQASAPASVSVVCVQNGVANEPAALRLFDDVYGVCVVCPALHLEPGVVEAHAAPVTGILDLGRFPNGVGPRGDKIAAAFASSTFESVARDDIMRWKYGKLLNNLGNAVDALCGPDDGARVVHRRAWAEGAAVLEAADIDAVSPEEDSARRGAGFQWGGDAARSRPGASSWQSLARGTGSIEADYLNGEIVMLGRLHGVPTPVNLVLQQLAATAAREGRRPGSLPVAELIRMLPTDV
jgi:2-dehydropantoate 2-reductase